MIALGMRGAWLGGFVLAGCFFPALSTGADLSPNAMGGNAGSSKAGSGSGGAAGSLSEDGSIGTGARATGGVAGAADAASLDAAARCSMGGLGCAMDWQNQCATLKENGAPALH